ncbi:MAG: long-chain fatty acid--CoA ligase [Bacteroidales bacterium]|nr:long-chain fatty acid--CoA ligase [Bacteroidales bacterium]
MKNNNNLQSLNQLIEEAIKKNWNLPAFSDMNGITYQFRQVALTIEKLHILFKAAGVREGDKIAICGKNSSNWAVIFLACLTKGIVAVPLLHEFNPETITHLVNHSDAKLLFVDAAIWKNLNADELKGLTGAIFISEFGMPLSRSKKLTDARNNLNELFGKKYPYDFTPKDIDWHKDSPDELAVINYTSGSTGMSKGVMLPFRSLWSNIRYSIDHLDFLKPGDGIVNMLPLAHLYGMTIEMLHPFVKGCHCNFLTKVPSPAILMNAFSHVRPKLIVAVPLVIEKIIQTKVFPVIRKPMMKLMLKLPVIKERIHKKILNQLVHAFGGQIREIIIGGAALNKDVAEFLDEIKFPYTVGYGMTECGPLVSYAPPAETRPGSVGKIVDRMELMVDSDDPVNKPGNLLLKGDNVMSGYYKNPEATKDTFLPGGWMNTGDLVTVDPDGYIYIKGRSKTMILGPSGQNIYPEEIEQKINNLPYVLESLVIDDGGKLVALVYPDYESMEKNNLKPENAVSLMDDNLKLLNQQLPAYSKVSSIRIMDKEFEKTPKHSIKRYLYQKNQ